LARMEEGFAKSKNLIIKAKNTVTNNDQSNVEVETSESGLKIVSKEQNQESWRIMEILSLELKG
ncbi:hypothetical protein BGZ49_003921, partial [Haplosporangium sp. Z 27]